MTDLTILTDDPRGLPQVRGTLPLDLRERLRYVSQMSQGECLAGPQAIGVPIAVVEWLCHPTEKVDEHTGEVFPSVRLVLSDGQENRISTSSGVAVQAWMLVVSMVGAGPYDPPLNVVLRKGRSVKTGHEFTTLVVID